ncbi:MFS transporter [Acetoanaerobium noterae]|uniref:MFS transporter n=1 Tax=Acetoanaerobium noterae TaxID=745369 RepID=UPI003331EFBF
MANKKWKKEFYTLWSGQAFSVLSSSILQIALIWHLTATTQSAFVLSMASLAGFLPNAVLGMVAGTLVDRMNRKTVMVVADLFIAAVSLMLVVVSWNSELPIWFVIAVLAIRSVGTAFHSPTISAVTPLMVPTEELTKCAGYTQSLQTIGYMVGTAFAGILYPILSISNMVFLDVAGALIASGTVMAIKIPHLEKPAATKVKTSLWQEMKYGYVALRQEKGIFALVWIASAFMILYSPINALFPLMSLDYFRGTTLQASLAEIAFSIGMLGGGVILGILGGIKNRGIGIPFLIALMGASISISGLLSENGFWVFTFLCITMGLSVPFYNGPVTALMQEKILPEYLGRVFGLYGSIASFAMPIGLLISSSFADSVGVNKWFFLSGVLIIGIAALCLIIPSIRAIDKEVK